MINEYGKAAATIRLDPLGWFDTRNTEDAVGLALAIADILEQTALWVDRRFAMPHSFLVAAQQLAILTLHDNQPTPDGTG